MELIWRWLFFLPVQTFLWHPGRIAVVSFVFLLGFFIMLLLNRRYSLCRYWALFICAVVWALFAVWECYCKSQQYNIRVDLLLIYPILMVTGIFGLVSSIVSLVSGFRKKQMKE